MQAPVPTRHLTQRQLAERWDVSDTTLERWRCDGIGPAFLKLRGQVRYRLKEIEAYEAESLRMSTSASEGALKPDGPNDKPQSGSQSLPPPPSVKPTRTAGRSRVVQSLARA